MLEILCFFIATVFFVFFLLLAFCLGIVGTMGVMRKEAPHAYEEWRRNAAFSRRIEQREKQFTK